MRILIIEDDYHLNRALKKSLVEEGYATDSVYDGVDVYVRRLRRKLDDPFVEKLLETVYGAGYRLRILETR